MSNHHTIKCVQPYFDDVKHGQKPFAIRLNDRNYQVGDTVTLRLFDPVTQGIKPFSINAEISYVLTDFEGLKEGLCVFGLKNVKFESHC